MDSLPTARKYSALITRRSIVTIMRSYSGPKARRWVRKTRRQGLWEERRGFHLEPSCVLLVISRRLLNVLIHRLLTADRGPPPPREDVPLPTQPPYTAFVGNLAFDLTEDELGSFFGPHEVRIIVFLSKASSDQGYRHADKER